MKRIAPLIILLLLVATSASAGMILAGVLSSYRVPQAPNAPTGVTATAGFGQNIVNWTDGTGPGDPATSYTLYGGTTASPTTSIYSGSATTYTHTGLTATPYYYRLTATNSVGTSGYSSPDATATPTAADTDFAAYTNTDPTRMTVDTSTVKVGNSSMKLVAQTGNGPSLYRNTTVPSSSTASFERWIYISSMPAVNAYQTVFGLANAFSVSAWYANVQINAGGTQGLYYADGWHASTMLYSGITTNTWYRVKVDIDLTTTSTTGTFTVYNAAGTQLAQAASIKILSSGGNMRGMAVTSILGYSDVATTLYYDGLVDGF